MFQYPITQYGSILQARLHCLIAPGHVDGVA